jgi:hypothetical protein
VSKHRVSKHRVSKHRVSKHRVSKRRMLKHRTWRPLTHRSRNRQTAEQNHVAWVSAQRVTRGHRTAKQKPQESRHCPPPRRVMSGRKRLIPHHTHHQSAQFPGLVAHSPFCDVRIAATLPRTAHAGLHHSPAYGSHRRP